MIHIIYVVLAFVLLALLSKMAPELKAFLYRVTGSSITGDELRELKKAHVKDSDFYIALDLIEEHHLEVPRESLFERAVDHKPFRSVVEVMAQFSVTPRQFSWEFLCELTDSSVGIDLLVQLIYHQSSFDEDRSKVFDPSEDENGPSLFYRALIEYSESSYERAAEGFLRALDFTDEKELLLFAADAAVKSNSENKVAVFRKIYEKIDSDSSILYRISDSILVVLQTEHAPSKPVVLSDDESGVIRDLITLLESVPAEDETSVEFSKQLGSLYHLLGDLDRALVYMRRSLETDPEDQLVNYECYLIETKRGNEEIAAEYLEAASVGFNEIEDIAEFFSGE